MARALARELLAAALMWDAMQGRDPIWDHARDKQVADQLRRAAAALEARWAVELAADREALARALYVMKEADSYDRPNHWDTNYIDVGWKRSYRNHADRLLASG